MTDQKTQTPAAKAETPKVEAAAPVVAAVEAAKPVLEAAAEAPAAVAKAAEPALKAAVEAPVAVAKAATPAPAPAAAAKAAPARARKAAKPARKARTTRKAAATIAPARKPAATNVRKPAARKAAAAAAAKTIKKTAPVRKAVARTVTKSVMTVQTNSKEGIKIMKNEANKVADRIQAVFGDVNERAKTAIERNTRIAEEMTDLAKGNVEAFVASTKLAAKGVEKFGHEVAEYSRKSFEDTSAAIKGFAEVKSPTDLFRLQGEFARTQFDALIAESSKLSETVIKLAGDVFEPLTSRASVAAERVKNAVAL
jgi:phasin family protein